eukprot:jgi/Tetstr1/437815/TSEL_026455.t1
MFKGEQEGCEVTPHSEAAGRSYPVFNATRSWRCRWQAPLRRQSSTALVGVLVQQHKRAGGIIKHNTNAVKNMAATQAFPGDNVDEGSSPEPPAKKAKQPAKPAAGVPAQGRGGAWAMAGGGPFRSRAGRQAASTAVAAAATLE